MCLGKPSLEMAGMVKLCLLVIMNLLPKLASSSFDHLDQVLNRIESLYYPGQTCSLLIWQSRTLATMEWYNRENSRVQIYVSDGSVSQENLIANFIEESCSCILQIMDHRHINKSEEHINKKADSSIIILTSTSKLADVTIESDRPVFLVSYDHKSWHGLVITLCPDKSLKPTPLTRFAMWQGDPACRHALHGKMINASYFNSQGRIIRASVTGIQTELLKITGDKLGFHPQYILAEPPQHMIRHGRVARGTVIDKVSSGHSLFGLGHVAIAFGVVKLVDNVGPLFQLHTAWVTRHPKKILSYKSLLEVLPSLAWILILFSLIVASATFGVIYLVYRTMLPEHNLARKVHHMDDFVLKPLAQLVEPIVIEWFPRWSSGKALSLIWSIACMTLVFIYLCDLRAQLMAGSREAPIDSTRDVIRRGRKVYVPYNLKSPLENNQSKMYDIHQALLRLVEAHRGFYDVKKSTQILQKAREDAFNTGAVYMTEQTALLYDYIKNKSLGIPNFSYSRQAPFPSYYSTIILPKYVPWASRVKSVFQWLHDTGIVEHTMLSPIPFEGRIKPKLHALEPDVEPLSVDIFIAVFIFGATGLLLGTATLFAELFVGFKKKHSVLNV